MKNFRQKYFGDAAFYKMVFVIAVPIMIQNGITNFVNMLDNIMIGQIGTEAMSGVSIVNQILFVYNLCLFGAVSGAGIFTAQYYGQKNTDGIRHTVRSFLRHAERITLSYVLYYESLQAARQILVFLPSFLCGIFLRGLI